MAFLKGDRQLLKGTDKVPAPSAVILPGKAGPLLMYAGRPIFSPLAKNLTTFNSSKERRQNFRRFVRIRQIFWVSRRLFRCTTTFGCHSLVSSPDVFSVHNNVLLSFFGVQFRRFFGAQQRSSVIFLFTTNVATILLANQECTNMFFDVFSFAILSHVDGHRRIWLLAMAAISLIPRIRGMPKYIGTQYPTI